MRPPSPVYVVDLFPEERDALLDLLSGLQESEWNLPTACAGWSVKDVTSHIVGGDLGNLSRRRDGSSGYPHSPSEDLVSVVNRANNAWVEVTRNLSPRVLIDLLDLTGPQLCTYFASLDQDAIGGGVSWAGLDAAPVWLDVAREYTERWLHQQHIRDAVGKPGLTNHRFLAPVLATFVHALPRAFEGTAAPPDTAVQLDVEGEAGGRWAVVREEAGWKLYAGRADTPRSTVTLDQDTAWRLLTKGLTEEQANSAATIMGDTQLGRQALRAVAIIA